MNALFSTILGTIRGVDNEGSSKRATLFWIGGPIWGFVNVVVLLFQKKLGLPEDLPKTVVFCDFSIICGLAGLTVYERANNKSTEAKKEIEIAKVENQTL